MKKIITSLFAVFVLSAIIVAPSAHASPQGKLNQQINAGALSTDIRDASYVTVANPSFNLGATTVSNSCQTTTGTYGSTTQRVYVDNPAATTTGTTGWNLSIAATGGDAATWTSGSNTYKYNDASGAGCTNGQLTLDPAAATLSLDGTSTATGITKGTSASFTSTGGATPAITLLTAANTAQSIWRGYLTDIGVSQKIPAAKPAGTYTIDLTQTAVVQ